VSGKRAKALRRAESKSMVEQVLLGHDLEQLDIWTDPNTGEIYFTPKDEVSEPTRDHDNDYPDGIVIPDRAPEPEKEYPNDPRPVCVNCGKRQNETHHVVAPSGEFFICNDTTVITGNHFVLNNEVVQNQVIIDAKNVVIKNCIIGVDTTK